MTPQGTSEAGACLRRAEMQLLGASLGAQTWGRGGGSASVGMFCGSNIILGTSVRVFLGEISIRIGRSNKADCSYQCTWSLVQSIEVLGRTKSLTIFR